MPTIVTYPLSTNSATTKDWLKATGGMILTAYDPNVVTAQPNAPATVAKTTGKQ